MLERADRIPEGAKLDCDVAIVGAGPAGLTLAQELADSGLETLVLESGGHEAATPVEAGDQESDFSVYSLARTRARGFGGTSAKFLSTGWRARRLDPIDFEARPGRESDGWPFSADELRDTYARAERALGLSELGYDGAAWLEHEAQQPFRILHDDVETSVFQFAPATGFRSRAERAAEWASVRVLLDATVTELVTDGAEQRVEHLVVRGHEETSFRVQARAVVLAAGGIDNPRLLLASGRRGLGNGHDLVGRFFMEHLHVDTGVLWPADPDDGERLGFYAQHDSPAGASIQGLLRLGDRRLRDESLLNVLVRLHALPGAAATAGGRSFDEIQRRLRGRRVPEHLPGHLWNCARHAGSIGNRVLRKLTSRPAPFRAAVLAIESEQAPHRDSRVTLTDRVDARGLRTPRLQWRASEIDTRSIRRAQEILHGILQDAGLGRIEGLLGDERPPARIGGGGHHMGTTRMHRDPALGVVDPNGRVHGLDNLYVAGSSVFPTSGGSNPTLTIVALAIRLADHLVATLRSSPSG